MKGKGRLRSARAAVIGFAVGLTVGVLYVGIIATLTPPA